MGGQGLQDRSTALTKLSSFPQAVSLGPLVSFLGLAWLDHTWGHAPVYLSYFPGLLWGLCGCLRALKQGSEADITYSESTLWCGNLQRPCLLLIMKTEELEARAQRTPAPSCVTKLSASHAFMPPACSHASSLLPPVPQQARRMVLGNGRI